MTHATPLHIANAWLWRGEQPLCQPLSFSLQPGQWLELRGPNGIGKSTLLSALAGHTYHAELNACTADTPIAWFCAPFGLRPELSVLDHLQLEWQRLRGDLPDALTLRTALQRVRLWHRRHITIAGLSQGQRARLALAELSLNPAPLWLLDEPGNALDAEGIQLLGQCLVTHLQQGGMAIIATHQALSTELPMLRDFSAGVLELQAFVGDADSAMVATAAMSVTSPSESENKTETTITWTLRREFALLKAAPRTLAWPALFHAMVLTLFPLGLGSDSALLSRISGGLIWVSGLLANVLAAQAIFDADDACGMFKKLACQGQSLMSVVMGKTLFHALVQGLGMGIASLVLSLQFPIEPAMRFWLALSLLPGMIALAGLTSTFAAIALVARQSSMLIYILALPLFVPVLIFGTATVSNVQQGFSPMGPLLVLCAMALFSMLLAPPVTARLLRWAQG